VISSQANYCGEELPKPHNCGGAVSREGSVTWVVVAKTYGV
jgi:hypothetical protein